MYILVLLLQIQHTRLLGLMVVRLIVENRIIMLVEVTGVMELIGMKNIWDGKKIRLI